MASEQPTLAALDKVGQRGRNCTCGHSVPSGACCCYTTRCLPRPLRQAPGTWFCRDGRVNSLELPAVGDSRYTIYAITLSRKRWNEYPLLKSKIRWRSRRDLHPHSTRRQRVALRLSYESTFKCGVRNAECGIRMLEDSCLYSAIRTPNSAFKLVGSAGNAPVRRFRLYFATPDLQSGSRNASREMIDGKDQRAD